MYNEIIYFMEKTTTEEKDEYGDLKREWKKAKVYAKQKSISQTEFYQSQTSDKKPEIKFEIPDYMDYQRQQYLAHEGILYKILRTYRAEDNHLEITCYGGVRDVSAEISDDSDA